MKIRCLLVDDEPLAIALLQKHLQQLDFFEIAGTCNNALKAMEILNTQSIDLLFLDIKMPKISGLDLLKTLRNPPKTIITTAYREYAIDGYDLDIVDYLLKPITFDRFFKAIERYLRNGNRVVPEVLSSSEDKIIYLKSGNKYFKLNINDILYVESLKDYIKVHTTGKQIVAKYKISDLEKKLEKKGFLRVHRSFIVNQKNITAYTAADVEIGSIEIPIGFSYKEYVFKTLNADL
jgi:two-component system LytT family response regulator